MSGLLDFEFEGEYELELELYGEGVVREGEFTYTLDRVLEEFGREVNSGGPRDISLKIVNEVQEQFTAIDTAYLERLETLSELILPDSITAIDLTPKLSEIFKKNNTLIRGSFDSFAEQFAAENGLRFRPADLWLGSFTDSHFETDSQTLVIARDGSVRIKIEVSSPGSSGGNTFGGTFFRDLDRFFFRTMTAEDVIKDYKDTDIGREILKNGRLADFIEKARTHKIFMGKNC